MSRVFVTGATGHIGTYLVPRLVRAGHEVIALSRGTRQAYHPSPEGERVTRGAVDRDGGRTGGLHADAVIALTCSTADSSRQLPEALRPTRPLMVHCGTIWVH